MADPLIDTYAYWLMPHGLRGLLTTVFRPAAARSLYPGPRRPFPILAPGKLERQVGSIQVGEAGEPQVGEHTFWRGSLWGRTVALQGDSTFTKYDLFEDAGPRLLYWGTFRGNGYYDSEESHSFVAVRLDGPADERGRLGMRITDSLFDPRRRQIASSAEQTLRVAIVAHHDTWQDPNSQIQYADVLEMHYWGRYPDPDSREVYHLGKGLGTIRFESFNHLEPSGVHYQFAERFEHFTPPDRPALPWFDPLHNRTFVHNGFCEDFLRPPVQGGPVTAFRDWSGSPMR
jgi:hypothetical protein